MSFVVSEGRYVRDIVVSESRRPHRLIYRGAGEGTDTGRANEHATSIVNVAVYAPHEVLVPLLSADELIPYASIQVGLLIDIDNNDVRDGVERGVRIG